LIVLYDIDHVKTKALAYKDASVLKELNGIETLTFKCPDTETYVKEECYVRTPDNEYVIKGISDADEGWLDITAEVNLEDLKGKIISIGRSNSSLTDTMTETLIGTGWLSEIEDGTKHRTVNKVNVSVYDVLQEIQDIYTQEASFDAINKKIYLYTEMGSDRGSYFYDQLNLRKISIQSDTYDYCTRLIPVGAEGLTIEAINGGLNYVENYQYSSKVITKYWEDNRYGDAQNLMDDAVLKLNEFSKPKKAYTCDVLDLASMNGGYGILEYDLGDTITLFSKAKGIKEKQRIVKITRYLDEPEKNTCEISNMAVTFEEMQKRLEKSADTVDGVTTSDGYIDEYKASFVGNRLYTENNLLVDRESVSASLDKLDILAGDLTSFSAKICYVSTTGSDTNDGLTAGSALRNIQTAINRIPKLLRHQYRINVAAGTYTENLKIVAHSGDNGNMSGIMISGSSATLAGRIEIVSCTCPVSIQMVVNGTSGYYAIGAYGSTNVTLMYMTSTQSGNDGVFAKDNSYVNIFGGTISNKYNAVYAVNGSQINMYNVGGTGNSVILCAQDGGLVTTNANMPTGSTQYSISSGGHIIFNDGAIQSAKKLATPIYLGLEGEATGEIEFDGSADVYIPVILTQKYDDLPPVPLLTAKEGTSAPTLATFQGNLKQYTFAVDNELFGASEITHGYKEGTDLSVHVHWANNGLELTDAFVKWELEYSIADKDEVFAGTTIAFEDTILANTADKTHFTTEIGVIAGIDLKIGAIICWRLRRITSTGTAPAADPFGLILGVHVLNDTIGSETMDEKVVAV